MLKPFYTMLKFAAFGFIMASCQQTQPAADVQHKDEKRPVIWLVEDADTKIYLFGTVHMLPEFIKWQDAKIMGIFDDSRVVYFETDMGPESDIETSRYINKLGFDPTKSLGEYYTDQEREVMKVFAERYKISLRAVEAYRPWMAEMSISVQFVKQLGGSSKFGTENVLYKRAKENGAQIRKFETVRAQMNLFAEVSDEIASKRLYDMLAFEIQNPGYYLKMVKAWAAGDLQKFEYYAQNAYQDEYYAERLLFKRNAQWAIQIDHMLEHEQGQIFIAVGAAHLSGPRSMQNYINELGHQVAIVE